MSVHETAQIGKNVRLGSYVVIEKNVVIGNDVVIGHHAVIKQDTKIGNSVIIHDGAILGRAPSGNKKMVRKPVTNLLPLVIEDHVTIGNHCVLYRGLNIFEGVLVGDLASIRENVQIGRHSIIGKNVTVENNTNIGDHVTVQTGSYITAHMTIEDDVFIGPCFTSANDKYMGEGNYDLQGPTLKKSVKIGSNATLLPGIIVGEKAIIGAGTVVTKHVNSGDVVVGNPNRLINKLG